MNDVIVFLGIVFAYLPLALGLNRLAITILPSLRDRPAQGLVFKSSMGSLGLLVLSGWLSLGSSINEKLSWTLYLVIILGAAMLLYVSVMCVSESGRRFYLMHLIRNGKVASRNALVANYGKEHMFRVRLERLVQWNVLIEHDNRYRVHKLSAYIYSAFFFYWGRLLGFEWRAVTDFKQKKTES